jgi:hypothetical protein
VIGANLLGWFDKPLPWRRGNLKQLKNVLLMPPSSSYMAKLPFGKLPNRRDFNRFMGDDAARQRYWRTSMAESQRLGDGFLQLADSGRLHERIKPL